MSVGGPKPHRPRNPSYAQNYLFFSLTISKTRYIVNIEKLSTHKHKHQTVDLTFYPGLKKKAAPLPVRTSKEKSKNRKPSSRGKKWVIGKEFLSSLNHSVGQ